jgi:hypothetical protein
MGARTRRPDTKLARPSSGPSRARLKPRPSSIESTSGDRARHAVMPMIRAALLAGRPWLVPAQAAEQPRDRSAHGRRPSHAGLGRDCGARSAVLMVPGIGTGAEICSACSPSARPTTSSSGPKATRPAKCFDVQSSSPGSRLRSSRSTLATRACHEGHLHQRNIRSGRGRRARCRSRIGLDGRIGRFFSPGARLRSLLPQDTLALVRIAQESEPDRDWWRALSPSTMAACGGGMLRFWRG